MVSPVLLNLYRRGQPHNAYTVKGSTTNAQSREKTCLPAPITTTSLTFSDMGGRTQVRVGTEDVLPLAEDRVL